MIIDIVGMLKSERAAGDETAEQTIERIDAHIRDLGNRSQSIALLLADLEAERLVIDANVRDLELLKAWIRDSATARRAALDAIVGGEREDAPPALPGKPASPAAPADPAGEDDRSKIAFYP